jgi:acyl-[acyl carrier protein]--UDP-N-acetylglucosamine O-acyltransferase
MDTKNLLNQQRQLLEQMNIAELNKVNKALFAIRESARKARELTREQARERAEERHAEAFASRGM